MNGEKDIAGWHFSYVISLYAHMHCTLLSFRLYYTFPWYVTGVVESLLPLWLTDNAHINHCRFIFPFVLHP